MQGLSRLGRRRARRPRHAPPSPTARRGRRVGGQRRSACGPSARAPAASATTAVAIDAQARLRECESQYHIHHPFNLRLNRGELQPFQVRAWVANRFYYQMKIPQKDAAVLANCPDRAERRRWAERILDHDGRGDFGGANAGGIEAWTRLGVATGLKREDLCSHRHVRAGVRFAVDAYVNFARSAPWEEAAISSLTEMFAPKIHADRLAGWPTLYHWIAAEGLAYFRRRLPLAPRDVRHGA